MKKLLLLIGMTLFSTLIFSQTKEEGTTFVEKKTLNEVVEQAKVENKLVFIDCYTTWCPPCKMMANKIFPMKKMGDYINPKFVSAKFDMEKSEGRNIARIYKIRAYPTFLIIDPEKGEIGRIVGGMPADDFIDRIKEILVEQKEIEK